MPDFVAGRYAELRRSGHWAGFAVDQTADLLGLANEQVDAHEAAGLAALDYLLADKEPAR